MNYRGHKIIEGAGKYKGPVVGCVWNAKKATFDNRDYWLGAIEKGSKIIVVAGPDDVDGTKESAIEFVVKSAAKIGLGLIDIKVAK